MNRVVVRGVEPRRMHGFRSGDLALEALERGLNVFYAPNASGKSTLARAIGLLFNPAQCDAEATVLGCVEGPMGVVDRTVRRGDAAFDGFPGRPECYLLDLVRLLEGFRDRDDQAVLQRLVADNVRLSPGPPGFRKPAHVGHASTALDALRRVRRETGETAGVEDRLESLRGEAARAGAASGIVRALERAAERRRLETLRAVAVERLGSLDARHPDLARQPEGAVETATALKRTLAFASDALIQARAEMEAVCERAPLRPLRAEEREAVEGARRDVVAAEATVRAATSARGAAEARLVAQAHGLLNLLPGEDPLSLPHPTADDMAALRTAALQDDHRRAETLKLGAYEAAHRGWRERYADDEAELGPAIEACCGWLSDEPEAVSDRRPALLFAIAVVSLGLTVLAGGSLRLAISAVGIALAAGVTFFLRPAPAMGRRTEIEGRFPDLFSAKDAASVAERMRGLLLRSARREVRADLASRAQGTAPSDAWRDVAASLRLKATDPCLLSPIAAAIQAHAEAWTALREADAALAGAQEDRSQARGRILAVLLAHDFPADETKPEAAVGEFVRWFELAATVEARRGVEADALRELTERLNASGLPTELALAERMAALAEREPFAAERRRVAGTLAEVERALGTQGPVDPAFESLSDAELATLCEEKREEAAGLDALNVEIGKAEGRIADAESARRLPAAEDGYARAYAVVEAKWGEMVRGAVRARLHTALAERLRREDLPPIVRAANGHLERFSRGRYRLELAASEGEGLGTLVVRDEERGREQRFGELSTGTKVHTIVALRLGLIDEHERQANGGTLRFPLVADEAMAVSDPEASAAIAQALVDVAETRQVIVFTNQPDDLAILGRIVKDFAPRTLGSAIPGPQAGAVPTYRPPRGPETLDPTLPIRSHAVSAVLPFESEAANLAEWLRSDGAAWAEYAARLEGMRGELLAEYPRLDWDAISETAWTKNAFRNEAQRLAEECGRSAREFLRGFGALPRNQKRTVELAEAWLEENRYLREPPTEAEVRALARRVLGTGADAFQVEHAVRLFRAGFRE